MAPRFAGQVGAILPERREPFVPEHWPRDSDGRLLDDSGGWDRDARQGPGGLPRRGEASFRSRWLPEALSAACLQRCRTVARAEWLATALHRQGSCRETSQQVLHHTSLVHTAPGLRRSVVMRLPPSAWLPASWPPAKAVGWIGSIGGPDGRDHFQGGKGSRRRGRKALLISQRPSG